MRNYANGSPESQWDSLRSRHSGGDAQINSILASASAFADSCEDMNFTPPYLRTIQAQTLIVQGDRDPFYPVEISVEMAKAIPQSSLGVVPNGGRVPLIGSRWNEFLNAAAAVLLESRKPT
jgi:pimeloyl-ACP methyl ester carboxylesterase